MNIFCAYCRAQHWLAERLTLHSQIPIFGQCCHHGQVQLDPLPDPPEALKDLYIGNSPELQDFQHYIQHYNAALAFTSYTANEEDLNSGGGGPWVYKSGYSIYHRCGGLTLSPGQHP